MSIPPYVILILAFFLIVFFCAIISVAESAQNAIRRAHSESAVKSGPAGTDPARFLVSVRMMNDLLFMIIGFFGAYYMYPEIAYLVTGFIDSGKISAIQEIPFISVTAVSAILISAIAILFVIFAIIFGRFVPERIALSDPEKMLLFVGKPVSICSKILSPFTKLFSFIADKTASLLGFREKAIAKATEEDVKAIVQEGFEDGEIEETEQDLVERVFSFADRNVSSVLTHKCDIAWLDADMTREEVQDFIKNHFYTTYPIAEGNLDNVIGIVSLKDLIETGLESGIKQNAKPEIKQNEKSGSGLSRSGEQKNIQENSSFSLRDLSKPANFIPENFSILETLESFRDTHFEYALVTDEFGSVQGIVTLSDLLNAFVGDTPLDSKTAVPETSYEIRKEEDGSWIVDGQYPFYDLLSHLESSHLYNDNPYNTLSGLILDISDTIPKAGDIVIWKDFEIEILEMDRVRIDKVRIRVLENAPSDDDADSGSNQESKSIQERSHTEF